MNTDLHTDGQETEVIETEGTEINESEGLDPDVPEVDESAETGEGDEQEEESPEKDTVEKEDGVQKRINKIHREKMEAMEKAEAERQRREELEAKLKEMQKEELPDIPPIPDYLDEDYEEKMKRRDEIITKHAQEASRKQQLAMIEAEKVEAANKAHVAKIEGYVEAFDRRVDELGLDKESVKKSEEIVGKYIKQPGVAEYLLSDAENGPLNVQYISQNLEELEKVSAMPATQAAVYIATKISPEAQKLKPKQTNAPEPPYDPQGNRRKVDSDPFLAGATFE